jgi:uncharacterized repeat protein (TIGR03803 family)
MMGEAMQKVSTRMTGILILAMLAAQVTLATPAQGQATASKTYKEKVLHTFASGTGDGGGPWGGLIRDAAGTLYGTTYSGGITSGCLINNGCGTVFKIDKTGKETVLHFFTGGSDGAGPYGSLIRDAQGNFYGTTSGGGDPVCLCGVVYKLDFSGTETVLHTFTDAPPSNYYGPAAGLIRDKAGNLYGTTFLGGDYQLGSVFTIDMNGTYSLLHSFNVWDGLGGYLEPPALDAAGNLYGMTTYGGSGGYGTVFRLDTTGKETVLYGFTGGKDGAFPSGNVVLDKEGSLYGSTYEGGSAFSLNGAGVVFKLSKSGKFTLLYTFPGQGHGGSYGGGVILDKSGNLYGTTSFDGANSRGSVFEIDSSGKETDLYSFTGGADGDAPFAPVIRDAKGNFYGTTTYGGASGAGVVFKLSPQ